MMSDVARTTGVRATVRDVAAETGLSIATVSRVLNGQANVAHLGGAARHRAGRSTSGVRTC